MGLGRYGLLLLVALFLQAGFIAFYRIGNFAQHVVEFIAVYLTVSLFYLVCCFLITRPETPINLDRRGMALIWLAGLAFRLTVLPLEPGLSEDLYRYRWQGKLQAAGGNPYTEVPEDPRWSGLRDTTWPQVNRKDLSSVYGPVLEQLYGAYYRFVRLVEPDDVRQAWLFKIPFALLDIAVALALSRLLATMGLPNGWLLIYFWSPLVVVEFWAQGHNDTLLLLFVVLALFSAQVNRWTQAFAWLTLATLTKFWPALLFPFFLVRREGKGWIVHWKPALISLPIAVVVSWPYWQDIANVRELLEGFIGGWRNNDSLYGLIYGYVGEDFDQGTALVTRLLLLALAVLWSFQLPLVQAAKWAVAVLLFLSANCFPWYVAWLVPFLAIRPDAALLLWTALVGLSYQVLIQYQLLGLWQDSDEIRALEYIPVFTLLIGTGLVRWVGLWRKRKTPH